MSLSFLDPLFEAVAWVIIQIHAGLSLIFPKDSGWVWGLSIFLLTVLMRIIIFPLFVKQIHASRKMQELNPQVQALRKKYKKDKQRLNQEMMKLYQEAGAKSPFRVPSAAGAVPHLHLSVQRAAGHLDDQAGPVEVRHVVRPHPERPARPHLRCLDPHDVRRGVRRQAHRRDDRGRPRGRDQLDDDVLHDEDERRPVHAEHDGRQPDDAVAEVPGVPLAAVRPLRLTLPLGVLIYWVTTNTWTLAQSHYVYKKYPMSTPEGETAAGSNGKAGTTAKTGTSKTGTAKAGTARRTGAKAGVKSGSSLASTVKQPSGLLGKTRKKAEPEPEDTPPETPKVVRQQPSRQSRSKRKR